MFLFDNIELAFFYQSSLAKISICLKIGRKTTNYES